MKTLFVLALAVFSLSANAETFTCGFTEPFFNVTLTEGDSFVKMVAPEGDNTFDLINIKKEGEKIRILFTSGDEEPMRSLDMVRDWNGSDGMSDLVYPYSVVYNGPDYGTQYGGCYTDKEEPREIDWDGKDGNQGK